MSEEDYETGSEDEWQQDDTEQFYKDPCPSLKRTKGKLLSLNAKISKTRLFDLTWCDGEQSFMTSVESEINNAALVAEESEPYTKQLIDFSTGVYNAMVELSILVKEKLAREYKEIRPGKSTMTTGELERLFKNTVSFNRFDAMQKRLDVVANSILKIGLDAATAMAQLKAAKMVKTFWDQNKTSIKSIEDLYQKRIEEEEKAKRREEEKQRRKEEEERRRRREEEERREREEREMEEEHQRRIEEEEEAKRREEEEQRRKEEEEERREREERERKEREKREKEERERAEKERKEREKEKRRHEEEEKKRKEDERKRKKAEENERKRKSDEKRRLEEEAERARRDPKNWKTLFYNAKEKTKQNKGLCCVFRAFTNSLPMSDLTVAAVPLVKNIIPIKPEEELASTVLDITSVNGELSFPFPAVLALPNFGGMSHFSTTVGKIKVDEDYEWRTVPAKETKVDKYKDLAECELPAFTRIRIALIKAVRRDPVLIKPTGSVIVSSAEPKISITFPRDALTSSRKITLVVRQVDHKNMETLKRHSKGCENLRSASHMLCIENMEGLVRFKEKIKLTMPAVEHLKKKDDKSPPVHTLVVQFGTDGHWAVCNNAETETEPNEEGVVTVLRSNPLTRLVVLGMATPSEAEAEYTADRLNQHLDEHVVRFIQRQSENDKHEVVTDCVHTDRYKAKMLELNDLGFTEGPVMPSGEKLVREGQEFTMSLSKRGNIRRTGFGENPNEAAMTFVYHSNLQCSSREFSVVPLNIFGQRARDFYFGHNEYCTEEKSGKQEMIHEFEIKLPKRMRANTAVSRAPRVFGGGTLDEEVFHMIASSLVEDEWTQLASRLQLKKAKIQRIEHENGGEPGDLVFAALWDWYKCTTISGNKVDVLCRALRRIDKGDIADDIEEQDIELKEEIRKAAQESELKKTFLSIQESAKVIQNWKMLGHHLEVPDDDIEAIDIDESHVKEKVYNVLTTWKDQAGDEATLESLIAILRKMGINSVADHLERRQSCERPKTAAPSSRPKSAAPSSRPKTAASSSRPKSSPRTRPATRR